MTDTTRTLTAPHRTEDEARMDRARLRATPLGTFQSIYSDRFALRHAQDSLARVQDINEKILACCAELQVLAGQLGEPDLRSAAEDVEAALHDNLSIKLWAGDLERAKEEWERV